MAMDNGKLVVVDVSTDGLVFAGGRVVWSRYS